MSELTSTQLDCIHFAATNHNKLIRYNGSNWAKFNADIDDRGFAYPSFRNATVKALVDRKIFEFTDFSYNPYLKRESFMSVTLTIEGLELLADLE